MANPPFPAPPLVDPAKVSVRVGDYVITPATPVNGVITGSQDGIPTPGIQPPFDPFNPTPKFEQPVPQQWFNWANGAQMNADAFKALIQAQSPPLLWEKAATCPCRLDNGDHDPTCTLCSHGIYYYDGQEVPMLITSASLQQNFYMQGSLDMGSIMVTSLYENPISYGDRITIKANEVRDNELKQRTKGTRIDSLKFPALAISYVRTRERIFVKDSDYWITATGMLEWSKSKNSRPEDGEFFTVVYTRWPVYVITEMLHHHRDRRVKQSTVLDQAVKLPIQGIAKLYQLVRDEGKDAPEVSYSSPFKRS